MLPHVVVGYAKYQLASESTLDGEHAIIEQQTWENLSFRNLVGRERLIELGDNLSFLGDLVDDATTLAIEFVELQEFLHLAIVGLGIGVDHNSWRTTTVHVIAKIVEHHVAIEHSDILI